MTEEIETMLIPDLKYIIDAVVTNNLGIDPYISSETPREEISIIDCRKMPYEKAKDLDPNQDLQKKIVPNPDEIGLHSHLKNLEKERVFDWRDDRDKRLPLYHIFRFNIIYDAAAKDEHFFMNHLTRSSLN